jgi:hypothetical protein
MNRLAVFMHGFKPRQRLLISPLCDLAAGVDAILKFLL